MKIFLKLSVLFIVSLGLGMLIGAVTSSWWVIVLIALPIGFVWGAIYSKYIEPL